MHLWEMYGFAVSKQVVGGKLTIHNQNTPGAFQASKSFECHT